MDTSIAGLLQQLPPGGDLFASIEQYIQDEVTPDLGLAFWIQAWVAVASLALMSLCILGGVLLRYRRGRLSFILYDGAVTRLDNRVCIPILWCAQAFIFIALIVQFHRCMSQHAFTPAFGRFWSSIHIPLISSYCLISSSVLASAPPVRSWLSKTRFGIVIFNSGVAVVVLAILGGLLPTAIDTGTALGGLTTTLKSAQMIVEKARSANDPTQLSGLLVLLPDLQKYGNLQAVSARQNFIICSVYICVFLLTGFAPTIVLARVVNRKIARLENNSATTFGAASSIPTSPVREATAIQLQPYSPSHAITLKTDSPTLEDNSPAQFIPELPADRPFASLTTAPLPSRFQDIIEDKSPQSGKQRAERLKAVLRHDQLMTLAYCLLLLSFLGFVLFEVAKKHAKLSTKQDLSISFAFPLWNFLIPGLIVAINFLLDAFRVRSGVTLHSSRKSRMFADRNGLPARVPVIEQTVNIVCDDEGKKEKDTEKDKEEEDEVSWHAKYTA